MIASTNHSQPIDDNKDAVDAAVQRGLRLITQPTADPTVESLTKRIDVLEGFILEWMTKVMALQRDMLNTARASNSNVVRILDLIDGKVEAKPTKTSQVM